MMENTYMGQKELSKEEIYNLKNFISWLASEKERKNLSDRLSESKKTKDKVRTLGQISAKKMKETVSI